MKAHRVLAIFERHLYVTLHSPHRIFEVLVWPLLDLLLWGLLTVFVARQGNPLPAPVGFLIGGVLLWDLLFRSQLGIAITFLEETWTRSVVGLLATPLAAIFYPVSVLPGWAQALALAMPPAHVFEATRSVLSGAPAPWSRLVLVLGPDVLYLMGSLAFARAMFTTFRRRGFVTRYM